MHIIKNGNAPLSADNHASLVTAIAAGASVNYGGYVYTGIVPEAEVYITCAPDNITFVSGLDALADCNVNVINISLGFNNTPKYTDIDRSLNTNVKINWALEVGRY